MAIQEAVNPPSNPGASKSRKPWLIIIAGVVLVVAAVAAGYLYGHSSSKATAPAVHTPGAHVGSNVNVKKPPHWKPVYYALDPAFVVNFKDDSAARFLQVTVEVEAREPTVVEAMKSVQPIIRNNLVMLFSSQSYATLSTRKGKEKLRKEALVEIQKVLKAHGDKAGVEAVYFTSFVMQ